MYTLEKLNNNQVERHLEDRKFSFKIKSRNKFIQLFFTIFVFLFYNKLTRFLKSRKLIHKEYKMKLKKFFLSLGALGTVALPMAAVIACSDKGDSTKDGSAKGEHEGEHEGEHKDEHGDEHGDEHEEGHEHHDYTEALIAKFPSEVTIDANGKNEEQIKELVKDAIKATDDYEDLGEEDQEALDHLLEHDFDSAEVDSGVKTVTVDAHGKNYVITYTQQP